MANPFNCGVYRWLNTVTRKSYIGSSMYISRRKSEHVRKLTAGSHENPKLQNAWNNAATIAKKEKAVSAAA